MFAAYEKCLRPTFAPEEKCLRPMKNGAKLKWKNQKSKLGKTIEQPQVPEE
jgi:hypothetical protein